MAGNSQLSLADRLERCYSGALYDVLRAAGYPRQVLPQSIKPLDLTRPLAGPIYTVSGHVDYTLDAHETLLRWTALLSKAPAGSVVVCQPHDSTLAHMGELSAETMQFRGVRGYIVDGGCRDSDFILKIGFRVFCRYFTPVDVVGRWAADGYGQPVTIGEVTIRTDDFVLADRDGIVIVPMEVAEQIVTRTEEVMQTESMVRQAILQGVDPQDAYLRYGKF